jgi:hypothetical protein
MDAFIQTIAQLSTKNVELASENSSLKAQNQELLAMIELLKSQVKSQVVPGIQAEVVKTVKPKTVKTKPVEFISASQPEPETEAKKKRNVSPEGRIKMAENARRTQALVKARKESLDAMIEMAKVAGEW